MKLKKLNPVTQGIFVLVIAATIMVIGHWSLMTLGELHGDLQIQFKHTLAMFSLLFIWCWFLSKPNKIQNSLFQHRQGN